ncbi:MAG: hypothetical protein L0I24_08350 [Pseudonocardia sp.]|nr:hypothetical protein [Pseudonocardia sp.]
MQPCTGSTTPLQEVSPTGRRNSTGLVCSQQAGRLWKWHDIRVTTPPGSFT